MTIYPVSCPLPTPSISSFLKYHQLASAGLEKERQATENRFISKPANKTESLACTGTAGACTSVTVCGHWLC